MLRFLTKLFVYPFYKSNAGFFLFFFFIFFGTVTSGTLVSYHQSLMLSFLSSPIILAGVMLLWLLYHFKCIAFCMKMINSGEGSFLYNFQTISSKTQLLLFFLLHLMMFLPVLAYAITAMAYGWTQGYYGSVASIGLFLIFICCLGSFTLYEIMNNWLRKKNSFSLDFFHKRPKSFLLFIVYYFLFEKKLLFLLLKTLSLALLYVALVLNKSGFDNDHFILFYLLILLAHAVFAYMSVQFLERRLAFYRNMPLRLIQFAAIYFVTYFLLFLPEFFYMVIHARGLMAFTTILAYSGIAFSTLCLLTAIQYSEHMNSNEYVKAVFGIFFVSTFALHAEAFLFWMIIQMTIAIILFVSGFYKYEAAAD